MQGGLTSRRLMSIVIKMVLTIVTGTISLSVAQSANVSSTICSKASTVISTIFLSLAVGLSSPLDLGTICRVSLSPDPTPDSVVGISILCGSACLVRGHTAVSISKPAQPEVRAISADLVSSADEDHADRHEYGSHEQLVLQRVRVAISNRPAVE